MTYVIALTRNSTIRLNLFPLGKITIYLTKVTRMLQDPSLIEISSAVARWSISGNGDSSDTDSSEQPHWSGLASSFTFYGDKNAAESSQ